MSWQRDEGGRARSHPVGGDAGCFLTRTPGARPAQGRRPVVRAGSPPRRGQGRRGAACLETREGSRKATTGFQGPRGCPTGDAGRGRGRLEASELGGQGTEPRLGVAPGVRGQGSDALRAGRPNSTFFLVVEVIKAHYRKRRESRGCGALPAPAGVRHLLAVRILPLVSRSRSFSTWQCAIFSACADFIRDGSIGV